MNIPIILRVYKGNQLFLVKQFDQDQISFGSSATADVVLSDDLISPLHALIEKRNGQVFLTDLGSESGTLFQGNKILEIELTSNVRFNMGPFEFVFSIGLSKVESNEPVEKAKPNIKVIEKLPLKPPPNPRTMKVVKSGKSIKSGPETSLNKGSSHGTFAPDSLIPDLFDYIKPSKGPVVEILVSWGDRILHAYHFKRTGVYRTGSLGKAPIFIPATVLPRGWPLLQIKSDTLIHIPVGSYVEVVDSEKKWSSEELDRQGRIQKNLDKSQFRLKQNEVLFVSLMGTDLKLIFRQVPATGRSSLSTPFLLSTDEWMGLIGSLVIVSVFILYVLARMPSENQQKIENFDRVAQIIVERPPALSPSVPPQQPPQPPPVKVPAKVEKVKLDEATREAVEKGKMSARGKKLIPKKAAEAAPKLFKNLPKKYTSVKSGGGVKLGKTAGGGASSDQKPEDFGLMSALGSGGVRTKIDQAYKGGGEVQGLLDKATGTSGMDADRPGEDLGSKVKDTGAGGKGIATHGISGVGAKGKNAGMSEYGSASGLGEKSSIQVVAGGAEEAFVGSIDKEAVRRVIRENLPQIKSCYERGLNRLPKGTRLEGRVTIRWTIVAKGHAVNVKVKESTLGNPTIESCIRDRIASWNYPEPPPGLEGDVEYPFLLKPIN